MPKVKRDPYSEKTEEYEKILYGAIGERQETHEDLAHVLRKSRSQVSRNLKNIDSFSVGEFRALTGHLGIKIELVRG